MPNIVNKVFKKYMYPAVLISCEFLDSHKNPITTFTFLVFNASLSSEWLPFGLVAYIIAVYAVHHFSRWLKEDTAREAKLEIDFPQTQLIHDQPTLPFCSVHGGHGGTPVLLIGHHIINSSRRLSVTTQKADALYFVARQASATLDELAQISSDLRVLDARIRGVIRSYSRLKTRLQSYAPERQLEAAERWVADTDGDFPPVAVCPAEEDSFKLGMVEEIN
ncbi:uncharacterized protein EV420DRAFT_1481172 [Desarmillaria tabescens]|uniref:Uncharacterized protein n=1 Tax=Armillaria tabescens TaxID=1929756 RepID=A0AA39N2F4_ARMTA|nr:uncharacterized protein EV420DRAFT_1481172 [Desarmillaria tabescens]KAK0455731.1 hypothetical protein EV420DRAFT_1481172 [Desarmillaria tabescens]